MQLHGKQLIGGEANASGSETFLSMNPTTGSTLPTKFSVATPAEVNRALELAHEAYAVYRQKSPAEIADFLVGIAAEIEGLGDALLEVANQETALPMARLQGERARTLNQLKLFAEVAREGSWVDARIDQPLPDRKPLPKPAMRTMSIGIGPVVVFGASNFPLAISVMGNDSVSALAVGCPVIVKAHRAHPGTAELVGRAVQAAVKKHNMPAGVFALLHGNSHELGQSLVKHPRTKAVAFTGSERGGRALMDAAASRPDPIPVYAEMSSLNPVFLFPGALAERNQQIGEGFLQSVTLGVGQFCTKPGLVFGVASKDFEGFTEAAGKAATAFAPATQLTQGINQSFWKGLDQAGKTAGVKKVGESSTAADPKQAQAAATIFSTDLKTFNANPHLAHENFGPSAVVIACPNREAIKEQIEGLSGHLSASIHATEQDLKDYADLIAVLETKVGRIVLNGFTTGLELCHSMHHGGPYPATSYSHFTSMGQAAYKRFVRPVCYQGFPDAALPAALKDKNTLGIWRCVDGKLTTADL
jgi:NADP-dependent aldehyde dehydrogenase